MGSSDAGFISDDDEISEIDEASDVVDDLPKRKRKKSSNAQKFLAMEACEDEDEDDEDWNPNQPLADRDEVKRLERQIFGGEADLKRGGVQHFQKTLGEIEQRFQEGELDEIDDEIDDIDGYDEQTDRWFDPSMNELNHLLPNSSDPLLWMMKLFKGKAKDMVIAICALAARSAHDGNLNYPIVSAFAPPSLPNTLYVEAYTMKDVTVGLTGIPNINRRSISLVPLEERSKIFQMGKMAITLPKKGTSVVFKRGLYEGDTGTVVEIDENSNTVMVKVLPRLDIEYLLAKESGQNMPPKKIASKNNRPQAKLFDSDTIAARDGNVTQTWKFGVQLRDWMRHQFDEQGYIYLIVKPSMLTSTHGLKPKSQRTAPLVGEKVIVTSGDLRGVVGTVLFIDKDPKTGDIANIAPMGNLGLGEVDVPLNSLERHFKEGDSVRILTGSNSGSHGLITALNTNTKVATVYLPSAGQEVKHTLSELQQSSVISTITSTTDSVCPYSRGELILLSDYKVGIVNRVTSNCTLELLLTTGAEHMVTISSIRKKLVNSGSSIADRLGRPFGDRSNVTVHQNGTITKGKVMHTWNSAVFVKCTGNGTNKDTILVVDKSLIEADETNRDNNDNETGNSRQHKPSYGAPRLKRGLHFGRQIKISKGQYKGLVGNIQGQTDAKRMQVMLQTTGEQIFVERSSFVLLPEKMDLETLHSHI